MMWEPLKHSLPAGSSGETFWRWSEMLRGAWWKPLLSLLLLWINCCACQRVCSDMTRQINRAYLTIVSLKASIHNLTHEASPASRSQTTTTPHPQEHCSSHSRGLFGMLQYLRTTCSSWGWPQTHTWEHVSNSPFPWRWPGYASP